MRRLLTAIRPHLGTALAVAAVSTSIVGGMAWAQPTPEDAKGERPDMACEGAGPGPMKGGMGGMGPGRPGEAGPRGLAPMDPAARTQAQLDELKTSLKLNSSQDKAWQAFAKQATQQAEAMKAQHAQRPAPQADDKLHAPELMARGTEQLKQQLAQMEAMNKAVKDLYAALTPEQQSLADRHFERLHAGMPPGMPGMPGGPGPEREGHGGPGPRG